jgi:thiol peroxidase
MKSNNGFLVVCETLSHGLTIKGACEMKNILKLTIVFIFLLAGCAASGPPPVIETGSSEPGGSVNRKGNPTNLLGNAITKGKPLPSVKLVESSTMKLVDLSLEKGNVLLLSIVPSIDTKVCEAQTHYLGEKGDHLSYNIERITISRDTPFAHRRFAEEAKLTDIRYLSDYREGQFGMANGLLAEDVRLLARSIIIVDQAGIVRYIQVVPEQSHLPDMEKAFAFAQRLAK